jgi:hypothetical protein
MLRANIQPQLWTKVLEIMPTPAFSRKSIYNIWADLQSKQWKRDPDEVTSAKILIAEASEKPTGQDTSENTPPQPGNSKQLYSVVELVPLHDEPGVSAIAFSLPKILRKTGGRVRELAMDSACAYRTIHDFIIPY